VEISLARRPLTPSPDRRRGINTQRQRRPRPRDLRQVRRDQGPAHAHEPDIQH
jgi:hypothetical protein